MQSLLTVTGEWAGELEIIIYVSLRRQPLLVVSPDQQGGRALAFRLFMHDRPEMGLTPSEAMAYRGAAVLYLGAVRCPHPALRSLSLQ
jgi:hypothetical protein